MHIKYIAIGMLVIALGGAGFYFSERSKAPVADSVAHESSEIKKVESNDTAGNSSTFTGSLSDLRKRGGSYECTFSHTSDVGNSTGVVYVSGDRVRGDFTSSAPSVGSFSVESHMIVKDDFTYAWTSLAPQGFKAKITMEGTPSAPPATAQYADQNQSYEYMCTAWAVDESKFTLPDLSFIEVN